MSAARQSSGKISQASEQIEGATLQLSASSKQGLSSAAAVSFISLSLQEQRAASEQVACNVERVAQSVEENAAQSGIVRTTQELKAMSDGLGVILQRFSF
ncbi:methyl-accepting chemotaxis protein [Pseudomonas sp. BT76 TE3572]